MDSAVDGAPLLSSSAGPAAEGPGAAEMTFRVTPAWKHSVNEAAASISAGLHHRNFRRRTRVRMATDSILSFDSPNDMSSGFAQHYRESDCRSCAERLVHRSRWRYFYILIVLAHLLLALVEPTSVRTAPDVYTARMIGIVVVEMFMSIFYAFDLWMRWFAGEDIMCDWWVRVRLFVIACIFGNGVLSLIMQMPNIMRVLRPLLLIERLRNVRKIASSVVSTLPKILQVLFLLTFVVMFGGVAAFTLFAGITGTADTLGGQGASRGNCEFLNGGITWLENNLTSNATQRFACSTFSKIKPDGSPCTNYFDTIWTSMMHLFILITTANFPDIMMPVYDCSPLASVFFIVFILVGLYFLLSLILAVVYTHFSSRNSEMLATMQKKHEQALAHAFLIMSDLTQRHAEEKNQRANVYQGDEVVGGNGISEYEMSNHVDSHDERHISSEVWLAVVQVYRPNLPAEISECLFSMYSGHKGVMNFDEFCSAIVHSRLKVKLKKKKKKKKQESKAILHLQESSSSNGESGRDILNSGTRTLISRGNATSSHTTQAEETTLMQCIEGSRRSLRRALSFTAFCGVQVWDVTMDGLICINTLLLFVRLSPELYSKESDVVLGLVNNILLFVFVVEITIKIFVLEFKNFWDDTMFNRIDLITVGGGMVSTILFWSKVLARDNRKIADVFLLVRAVRMLRVLRMNMQFRIISATVVEISPALLRYLAVLIALFYAFAVTGMELFAGILSRECYPDESAVSCEERVWRLKHSSYGINHYWSNNFSSLSSAFVVLFQQMVVNNWVIVMEGTVAAAENDWPRLYFISFWVCCVVIVMNVLIAFLIDAYQAHVESIADSMQRHDRMARRRLDSQFSLESHSSILGQFETESKAQRTSSSLLRSSSLESSNRMLVSQQKRLSSINKNWMKALKVESAKLGHDLSNFHIHLEKGVGDIYSEVYNN